jgi:hypothetical protein
MRSLYESLLDDEEDLINNSTGIKQLAQKWIDKHVYKFKGRVTINKKLELSIKNADSIEITGPFPEWLKFAPNNNTTSISFHNCTEDEINKFLDNVTVNSVVVDETFPCKDLSIFNKRFKSLDYFAIVPNVLASNPRKSDLQHLKLDFPVNRFSSRVEFSNLKDIDISKVTHDVHWVNYPMHTLKGFPKTVKENVYIKADTNITNTADLEVVDNLAISVPSSKSLYYDISDLLNMNINIQVGTKFTFNSVHVPLHLLRSDRKDDLEAWVVFMMVKKSHDLTLFNNYVKKHGGKEVKFDDMQPGHNYIIVDLESKDLTGVDDIHRFVWDTNYYSVLSEKNGNYKSSIVTDYDNPFGPDMDLPRIERFKKNYKSYYDNNKHKIIECSKEMEPLIYMDWRYK